jgi:N-acetylneuraminate synthase/sialic acid synthase
MALAAYMLGARVVEKHFTLDRAAKGSDHAFSLERPGLRKLVRDLKRARLALGDGIKRTYDSERDPLKKMGKKLVAARPVAAGELLEESDIAVKSPGDGLGPQWFDDIVGRRLKIDLEEDANIRWEDLEEELVRVSAAE